MVVGKVVGEVPVDPVHMRVRGLRKSYGEHVVLERIDLDVFRNAVNVILGLSGSGKTVLLRQLLRLERPDAGSIEVDGCDIVPLDDLALMPIRRRMGVVFQDSALLDSLSVYENLALPLREHSPELRGDAHVDASGVRFAQRKRADRDG